jgi:MscS family membrane protein
VGAEITSLTARHWHPTSFRLALRLGLIFIALGAGTALASPLVPVKTDTPRDTMRSFLRAMQDYKEASQSGTRSQTNERLDDAVRCLNLDDIPAITRSVEGRRAAIFLKETIDRVILIDEEKIPEDPALTRWRLKDTEITLLRVESGERAGEFLFSKDTVARAESFFLRVEDLPYLEGSGGGALYRPPWVHQALPPWAFLKFGDIALWQWAGLFLALLLGFTAKALVRLGGWAVKKILHHHTNTRWDDAVIEAVAGPLGLTVASFIWLGAAYALRFQGTAIAVLGGSLKILIFASFIWTFHRLAGVLGDYLKEVARRSDNDLDDQIVKLITRSLKIFVVVVGVLLCAQNLGIQVFSVLAGLGIGGLAVALAAKDSLANFFGSILIMLDRPFRAGHWIVVKGHEGTVEEIGFRSTKIRTFYNSVVSIPNSELAISPVDNMGMRRFRRVRTILAVTYDTPPEKISAFTEGIKTILRAHPRVRPDHFHVVFNDFGASSLDILLYFFLEVPDWATELREREAILLDIVRLAKELGVSFAFPTQTLHLESTPEHPAPDRHGAADPARWTAILRKFSAPRTSS